MQKAGHLPGFLLCGAIMAASVGRAAIFHSQHFDKREGEADENTAGGR
jgi:hypothetical protein